MQISTDFSVLRGNLNLHGTFGVSHQIPDRIPRPGTDRPGIEVKRSGPSRGGSSIGSVSLATGSRWVQISVCEINSQAWPIDVSVPP